MGTVKEQLSEEAKEKIQNADIIIAKGMGNFESMYQEGMNPYYLLLCKCELYKEIFGVEMFQPIFCKEERLWFAAGKGERLLCCANQNPTIMLSAYQKSNLIYNLYIERKWAKIL